MSSNRSPEAWRLVSLITEELSEYRLAERIDESINRAVERIPVDSQRPQTDAEVLDALADTTRRLYEDLNPPRLLSHRQALAEAICLLVRHNPDGVEQICLDVRHPTGPGSEAVVSTLAEALKARRREEQRHWVHVRYLSQCDWDTRREMARLIVTQRPAFWRNNLDTTDPDQLTHSLADLLDKEAERRDWQANAGSPVWPMKF